MSGAGAADSRRRRRNRRKRKRRGSRGRAYFASGVVLLVAGAAVLLHFYVSVTTTFEGRHWQLPSRVWSAALELAPGDRISLQEVAERLDRAGYARTDGPPARRGQYHPRANRLDLRPRPFASAGIHLGSGPVSLEFHRDRLQSISDERGRPIRRVALEPELLATLYGRRQEAREPMPLDQIPETLIHAVLAAEDARFFTHGGLDVRGILRAAWANLRHGGIVQGGSTITQQTVKNLYLGQERSWWRKGREAVMASILDARYDKRRILEVYLNDVYLGQRGPVAICGAQAAGRFYFGRDLRELSLAEVALLAGMLRSPGRYNPFAHPQRAIARRDQVLMAMERLGYSTPEAVAAARQEQLSLASGSGGFAGAPFAVDFVRSELAALYSAKTLTEEGLEIHTTLDTRWQSRAEQALRAGLERLERESPMLSRQRAERRLEGAVLVIQPQTGEILALVGGVDYRRSQFNRAVQARRQPGSCFKPFVYAAGFERAVRGEGGLTPATLLEDSPLELRSGGQTWRPVNYDRSFRGPVTVRLALEQSLNVPTVRAAEQAGLDETIRLARRSGIGSRLTGLPSLALGAQEVTPLELATAYATLARLGRHLPTSIVREVDTAGGAPLARRSIEESRAISPQAAYLVNDVLQGVIARGTGRSALALGYHGAAAGKTGTTDDTRDAWFVGYTPEILVLVWVGFDDGSRTGLTGATGALPIWVDLVRADRAAGIDAEFEPPPGILRRQVDPTSGGLAGPGCPEIVGELFASGSEPTQECDLHRTRMRRWFRKLLEREKRGGPTV